MMENGVAIVSSLKPASSDLQSCALDFPADGKPPRLSERGLYLQAWLLVHEGVQRGDLVLRTGGIDRFLPFNNERPDVIQRVLGVAPDEHPQQRCGVIAWLKDAPEDFELGVVLNGEVHWLWQVRLGAQGPAGKVVSASVPQVILGTEGWLFLDNDTNHSVDQYTGARRLDEAGIERWRDYLDQCAQIAASCNARHAIVFAASKEQVLPQHYPHPKGEVTVLEQVLALCRHEHHVQNTAALLAARPDSEACFIKTDTHWTDRGAFVAVLSLLRELGLDPAQAEMTFARDVYFTMPFAGDLGVKLNPAAMAVTEFLQAPPAAHGAVFDNQLANIGRVLLFENRAALWTKHLLLFGASSSYPMLKYLKRLFSRIVFVHTAGNVDPEITAHEQADFLVMQTTARFMIEPPGADFTLRDAVRAKLAQGGGADRLPARPVLSAEYSDKNLFYVQMARESA